MTDTDVLNAASPEGDRNSELDVLRDERIRKAAHVFLIREEECRQWIELMIAEELPNVPLAFALHDGVVLCTVANAILEQANVDLSLEVNVGADDGTFTKEEMLENINTYCTACADVFAIPKEQIFTADDLFSAKNMVTVLENIRALSDAAAIHYSLPEMQIIDKETAENLEFGDNAYQIAAETLMMIGPEVTAKLLMDFESEMVMEYPEAGDEKAFEGAIEEVQDGDKEADIIPPSQPAFMEDLGQAESVGELENAATKISAAFRGHRVRQSLSLDEDVNAQGAGGDEAAEPSEASEAHDGPPAEETDAVEEEFTAEDEEAITRVQAMFRGKKAREDMEKKKAAVDIQRIYRGHKVRVTGPEDTAQEPEFGEEDEEAVTKVQAMFRGKKARENVEKQKAAVAIQKIYRGHHVREVGAEQASNEVKEREEKKKDEESITKLQAMYRGKKARERVEQEKAAVDIQRVIKGKKARDSFRQEKAAVQIQKVARGRRVRNSLQLPSPPVANGKTKDAAEPTAHDESKPRAGLSLTDMWLVDLVELARGKMGWEFVKESLNVQIFRRMLNDSSRIHVVKGVTYIHAPAADVFQAIESKTTHGKWDPNFVAARTLRHLAQDTDMVYFAQRIPSPTVSDRDFVCIQANRRLSKGTYLSLLRSIVHKDHGETSDYERGEILLSGFLIAPDTQTNGQVTKVTYVLQVDLGGWLPAVASNLITEDMPLCIGHLRRYLEQGSMQTPAEFD